MRSAKASLALFAAALLLAACGTPPIGEQRDGSSEAVDDAAAPPDATHRPDAAIAPPPDGGAQTGPDASRPPDASLRPDASAPRPDAGAETLPVRVMAANLSSGPQSTYDPGEGRRLIQGGQPDVVLIQEFLYGGDTDADFRAMVDATLGTDFEWCREKQQANPFGTTFIPNGILSRWPILECGSWDDPKTDSRGFAYARIDVPGERDLWAVSLHLMTNDPSTRDAEAVSLVAAIRARVPAKDLLVVGGDLNTDDNTEKCYGTLSGIVDVAGPHPADQNGNIHTSGPRSKDLDKVLANPALRATQVPTEIGASVYPNGLVLDSRVYTPLEEIAPVLESDSAAENMQHMGVVKDFLVPY